MKPFKVTTKQLTPIILGNNSPNLAGILYHCCLMHTGSETDAKELLESLLLTTDGIYNASDAIFEVSPSQQLIATKISTTGIMNDSDLSSKRLNTKPMKNGKYKPIETKGGPFKNRVNKHKAYLAQNITFYGYGEIEKIVKLLNHYIFCVGLNANTGFGNVGEWTYIETNEDHSFIAPTNLNCPKFMLVNRVPFTSKLTEQFNNYSLEAVTKKRQLKPPFNRDQISINCYVGNRINKALEA